MKRLKTKERREAEQMSRPCGRALIASPGCGTCNGCCSHSAYRYSVWHPLNVFAADLEPFLIMQAIRAIESMLHCDPGPVGVSFWQEYSRAICSCRCCESDSERRALLALCIWLESEPAKSFLLTSVSFRAGSELIPMGGGWLFLSRHKWGDASMEYTAQPTKVFRLLVKNPSCLYPNSPQPHILIERWQFCYLHWE